MTVDQNKNLGLVQVLRGVASLLVVLFHTSVNSREILGKDFCFDFFFFGGSGVDIFFVLSGFIITYTSFGGITHPDRLLPFIRRRFIRIFPSYWIIIGFFLVVQLLLPSFYKSHFDFSILNFCSTWFLLPGHTMVNGVSWTMSYELFFYLLFSLAFIIPNRKWSFSLFAIYALVIIALPLTGTDTSNGGRWAGLILFPMNIEFFLGVVAAVIILHIRQTAALPLIITGALFFLADGILYDQNIVLLPNAFNRVVLFGIPSFLIITGIVKFELTRKLEVHNVLLLLGEASYSLYLLHLPLLVAAIRMISRLNIQNNIILHLLLLLVVALICYISILFFKWVEKPVISKLNARYKK